MNKIEDIRDVFSIFHDGYSTTWSGNHKRLLLKVGCPYLAELIDSSFNHFIIEFFNIHELYLETWPNPIHLPAQKLTSLTDIFKAELDFLQADIQEDKIVITCNQTESSYDYCGGYLTLKVEEIKVYDQEMNELTIEELDIICNNYWNKESYKNNIEN